MSKVIVQVTTTCPTCHKKFTRNVPLEYVSGILGLDVCPDCESLDEHGNFVITLSKPYSNLKDEKQDD